jgi:hypothetical protein
LLVIGQFARVVEHLDREIDFERLERANYTGASLGRVLWSVSYIVVVE